MKDLLFIDFETRSKVDLKTMSAYKYARDPSTHPILLAYAFGHGAVRAHDMSGGDKSIPEEIKLHVEAGMPVVAWNMDFDRNIWNNTEGLPYLATHQCIDAMGVSSAMGAPRALDKAAAFFKVKGKLASGAHLIRRFSVQKEGEGMYDYPDMRGWLEFAAYARQDVRTMREIYEQLVRLSATELSYMRLDMDINDNGIPIDMEALAAAQARAEEILKENEFTCKAISGFAPTNPKALLKWVNQKLAANNNVLRGKPAKRMQDFTAQSVEQALDDEHLPEEVRIVLQCRQIAGKTSVAKLAAMYRSQYEGRVHGALAYHAATTGRAGGRIIQPQNMPRPHLAQEDIEAVIASGFEGATMQDLSSCLRGLVASRDGLIGADLSNIEGRMLAWLAGEEAKVEAFRQFDAGKGEDIYKIAAAGIFNTTPDNLPKDGRQVGKTAELACGFQGGMGAFQTMARTLGVVVQDAKAERIVKAWRGAHPKIVRLWKSLESKAILTVRYGKPMKVNSRLSFRMEGKHLMMRLPSGRELCYPFARLIKKQMPWGSTKTVLAFEGKDTYTNKWGECTTYGGKLCENATQAAARDVLYAAMKAAHDDGHKIVLHIHDEIVVQGDTLSISELCSYLTRDLAWAEGLPLAAEGWSGERFRK